MTPISILNALITHGNKHKLTNNVPFSLPQTNVADNSPNQTNWHWTHYHWPYLFGSKLPNFHDYDNNNNNNYDDADADDDFNDYNTTQTTNGYNNNLLPPPLSVQTQKNNYNINNNNYNNAGGLKPNLENMAPLQTKHLVAYSAQLSCDSGEMILRLNFSEPFKGIVYPDHNRLSPCRFFGDGHHNYELRLPLRGCGTRQVSNLSQVDVDGGSPIGFVGAAACKIAQTVAVLAAWKLKEKATGRYESDRFPHLRSNAFPSRLSPYSSMQFVYLYLYLCRCRHCRRRCRCRCKLCS